MKISEVLTLVVTSWSTVTKINIGYDGSDGGGNSKFEYNCKFKTAVTKINIGYDGSDGGVTPSSSTIANLKQQNVISVSGLENVAPYLQIWAS